MRSVIRFLAMTVGVSFVATALAGGKNIVQTAEAAGQFKTLTAAIEAAGLGETLSGAGPFTVFAPTDEAFAKLPAGTVDALLKDLPKLRQVLKYHVVAGSVKAADVTKLTEAKTVLGQSLPIDTKSGVKVGAANVVKTDIAASNGVIHVIDTVLMPANDIVDTARGAGQFTTLVKALEVAGLTDTLRGEGPFTVFAPTDEAFAKLPKGALEGLLAEPEKLKAVLLYHVVPGNVLAADVVKLSEAKTAGGSKVSISAKDGVKINDAKVIKTDIKTANGVIHVIDTVLMPH